MPRRIAIPAELRATPFTIEDGLASGLGRGRMRGADLARPFRGVRTVGARVGFLDRCRSYLPRLRPGEYFSHATAGALSGCPMPYSIADEPLHVAGPLRAARGRGVRGHEIHDEAVVVVTRHGLPVADAASVFRQLGPLLALDDLIAVGDHLILDPAVLDPWDIRPHTSIEKLRARCSGSYRGARMAKLAVGLVRQGAESRRETLLRLILQRAGLPEPELNPELVGVLRPWRHRADVVYRRWKVITEYDGDQHRTDSAQYEKDIRRFDDFADDGWRVVRVRKRGIFTDPDDTTRRVDSALRAHGWRPGLS